MKRLAMFLAGILLGAFIGSSYRVYNAPEPMPTPPQAHVKAPDEEKFVPCEYVTRVYP